VKDSKISNKCDENLRNAMVFGTGKKGRRGFLVWSKERESTLSVNWKTLETAIGKIQISVRDYIALDVFAFTSHQYVFFGEMSV